MYREYKKKHTEPVSEPIFRKLFNSKFNLHFHQPITDSCKKCDHLENAIKYETDAIKKENLKQEKQLHLRKAEKAKQQMNTDSKKDDDTAIFAFDLMKTLPTPVISTGITYYKRQLWTYCLGIHNLQNNTSVMYVWDESVGSRGPEEIGSCLLHYIKKYVRSSKIIMYSDACGGQNRNIKIAAFCQLILNSFSNIVEIQHNFLVSGHSFMKCDSDFGLVEKNKKYFPNIYIPADWCEVIKSARDKNPFIVEVMEKKDFLSIQDFMTNNITNRKINHEKEKVQWLKILSLKHVKAEPLILFFSYGHDIDFFVYKKVNVAKRNNKFSSNNNITQLPTLHSNGHSISEEKKTDLLCLLNFIPPVYHSFYHNLKSSKKAKNSVHTVNEQHDDCLLTDDED